MPSVSRVVPRRNTTTSRQPRYSPDIGVSPPTRQTTSWLNIPASAAPSRRPNASNSRRISAAFGCSSVKPSTQAHTEGCDDSLGDHLQRTARCLARLAQPREGVGLRQALLLHQQSLRALDRLARCERLRQGLGLCAQRLQLVVAGTRRLDRGQQVLLAERLDEVAVDAGLDRARDDLRLAVGREHHDRDRPLLEDAPCSVDAVELRHLHVHDREVGLLGTCERDRLLAVTRLGADLEAGARRACPAGRGG